MTRLIVIAAFVASFAACGEEKGSSDGLASQWEAAGLKVADSVPLEESKLGGKCERRDVSGVTAITCSFASAEEASRARPKGLELIGAHTGAALVSDSRLLVVVDRDDVDRQGRAINLMTKTFLKKDGAAVAKPSDGEGAPSLGKLLGGSNDADQ